MRCPACEHENPDDAKFCANCGTALSVTCPSCSTVQPAGANFCNNCGTALTEEPIAAADDGLSRLIPDEMLSKLRSARSGQAMRGERRTVTMLFADIKGSTSAAEQLDPEEWADLMNAAFERLIEPIYRYEGTLARLLGDAVLAFFGAPIAHEDDPTRAIRAGLDIVGAMAEHREVVQREHGVPIDVRVGINTGLVVVGEVGSDLRVEYTALGDAINIAARMEQTAEPGTVQVTEHTLRLTHGAFDAIDLGPTELKGKAEPIRTFRPTAYLDTVPGQLADHGFVGRDAELARLVDLQERLGAGTGWITSIIGEAGLGKSALLREWERSLTAATTVARHPGEEGAITLIAGASQSYDASKPMSGLRTVLRRWFDITDDRDFDAIVDGLGEGADPDLAALLGHVAGVRLPESGTVLIESLDPPVLLKRAREAVVRYVSDLAADRPVLIGFEDLHWSDDLTIDMVTDLLAVTETAPVGVVIAMRPYRDDPSWRVHQRAERDHSHRYHRVELEPLPEEAATELLKELTSGIDLGPEEIATVLERSAGNPLFLEELAGSLGAAGSMEGVPDSLAGVLAARLDRLDEQARYVAQVSSVLGTQFRKSTIGALVDGTDLDGTIIRLLREGVLIESRTAPGRLRFRHALLRDAAYSSVLLKTRRRLHGEVAEHLLEVAPDDAPDIARHFVAAEDHASAFPHLVEAGARATRAMALADAIRDLRMAIDHAPDDADPDLVERAHLALGEAYALLPDLSESAAAFQRLFDYGEQEERPTAQVAALNRLGFTTATVGGDIVKAEDYLRQAKILAETVGDERGLIEYHMNACMVAAFGGDPGVAAAHDEQTTQLGASIGDDRIRVEGLRRRAMNQALFLDFDQARKSLDLAIAAIEQLGSDSAMAELQVIGAAILEFALGDYAQAAALVEPQLATLERFASFDLPVSHSILGQCRLELGDVEGALASFAETRRTATAGGQPFSENLGKAGMSAVYAIAGRTDEAHELLGDVTIGEGPMGDYFASTSWLYVGLAHLVLGDAAAAEEAFNQGLAAPAVTQYVDRTRLLAGLATALTELGDLDRATTILREAEEFRASKGFEDDDPGLALARGRALVAAGDESGPAQLRSVLAEADDQGLRWVALQTAWALAEATSDPGDANEAAARAEAIGAETIDEDLRSGFVARWGDPSRSRA